MNSYLGRVCFFGGTIGDTPDPGFRDSPHPRISCATAESAPGVCEYESHDKLEELSRKISRNDSRGTASRNNSREKISRKQQRAPEPRAAGQVLEFWAAGFCPSFGPQVLSCAVRSQRSGARSLASV